MNRKRTGRLNRKQNRRRRELHRRAGNLLESLERRLVLNADLTPTDLSIDLSTVAAGNGQDITVSWTVANDGTTSTSTSWFDNFYLSDDEVLDFTDTFTGFFEVTGGPIDAGTDASFNRTIYVANHPVGAKFLLVAVNEGGDQAESDTNNNVLSIPITLTTSDTDLLIDDYVVNGQNSTAGDIFVSSGQTVPVFWSIFNAGTVDAGASRFDAVYFSSDAILDAGDSLLAEPFSFQPTTSAGGNSFGLSTRLPFPQQPDRSFY